jgi:hypothetical protein
MLSRAAIAAFIPYLGVFGGENLYYLCSPDIYWLKIRKTLSLPIFLSKVGCIIYLGSSFIAGYKYLHLAFSCITFAFVILRFYVFKSILRYIAEIVIMRKFWHGKRNRTLREQEKVDKGGVYVSILFQCYWGDRRRKQLTHLFNRGSMVLG